MCPSCFKSFCLLERERTTHKRKREMPQPASQNAPAPTVSEKGMGISLTEWGRFYAVFAPVGMVPPAFRKSVVFLDAAPKHI